MGAVTLEAIIPYKEIQGAGSFLLSLMEVRWLYIAF